MISDDEIIDQGETSTSALELTTSSMMLKSEMSQAIETAHKYPRSIKVFRDQTLQLCTLSESVAEECSYALPRGGKVISGPSKRFAEIIASTWGNNRTGSRIVDEGEDFIMAQGVFMDLEKNTMTTVEIPRRIIDSRGKRFNVDMIGVTALAAGSIAMRNAITQGIPKAFWVDMYNAAVHTVMGDFKTFGSRLDDAIKAFVPYGITPDQLWEKLGVKGKPDVQMEHLPVLKGFLTSLKEGVVTPETLVAASDSKQTGTMDEGKYADFSAAMKDAADAEALAGMTSKALEAAKEVGDDAAFQRLQKISSARAKELKGK